MTAASERPGRGRTVLTLTTAPVAAPAARRPDALLLAIAATLISLVGSGRPSLWVDESATVSATARPLPELWTLVQHTDAVHGLYYLLMHVWSAWVTATEFWLRVPSALLVGAAAAGVVVLAREFVGRPEAIAAGVVFAVLPRTTWAGIEARPYALTMACAVWLTVLLIVAARRSSPGWWMAYAAALWISVCTNLFLVLLLAVHAVLLCGLAPGRRSLAAWAAASGAATVAAVPLLSMAVGQQAQVSWIWPLGPATAGQIFAEQYFPSVYSDGLRAVGPDQQQFTAEQFAVALGAWARVAPLICVLVTLAVVLIWRRVRTPVPPAHPDRRLLVTVCATWVLLPTAAAIAYSALIRPLYQPHYLTFTTPAAALLIGVGVVSVGRSPRAVAVILAVIAAAALPNYLAQRSPFAKYGADYSQVADLLAAQAAPGDCLVMDATLSESAVRGIEGARRWRVDGLVDVGVDETALQRKSLFASRDPAARAVPLCPAVWTVSDAHAEPSPGTVVAGEWTFNQTRVVKAAEPG